MDDLSDLELAGLVVSEVEIHLGVVDKNLADLIIAQRVASDTFEIFQQKMGSMAGVSLPVSLLKSVDRLLRMMHPSIKAKNTHAYHGPGTQRGVEQPHVRSQAYIEAQAQSRPSLPGQAANQAPVQDLINNPRKRGRSRSRSNSPNTQGNRRLRSNPSDYDRPRRTPYDADLDRLIMEDGERRGRQGRCEDDHSQREDEVPVLNNIYDGHVAGVKKFGAFVNLQIGIGNVTGLVHASKLAEGLNHPSNLVARGPDVDQDTEVTNPSTQSSERPVPPQNTSGRRHHPRGGETQQLTAAGVLKASDFPGLEDHNAALGVDGGMGLGEDLGIELKSEEPPFLIGQPTQSLERLSIRLIKTPDGTMSRAAVSGSVLAKERPELQLQRAARKSTTPSPPAPCTTPRQTHP